MANNDLNKQVKEALERTEIMALSPIREDGSWTSPVQYHCDEKLNLFFISLPNAKHVQNILKDPMDSKIDVILNFKGKFVDLAMAYNDLYEDYNVHYTQKSYDVKDTNEYALENAAMNFISFASNVLFSFQGEIK